MRFDPTISVNSILMMIIAGLVAYFTVLGGQDKRLSTIETRQEERLKQDQEWRMMVTTNLEKVNIALSELIRQMVAVQTELKMQHKDHGPP